MIAPGNGLIQVVLAIAFVIASGYALGRIHQWYRDSARREQAYRNGYDLASNSMFDMTLRKRAAGWHQPATSPDVVAPSTVPAPPVGKPLHEAVGLSRRRISGIRPAHLEQSKAAS